MKYTWYIIQNSQIAITLVENVVNIVRYKKTPSVGTTIPFHRVYIVHSILYDIVQFPMNDDSRDA